MHPSIQIRQESARGCGRRVVGGLYLVMNGRAMTCGKMPIPLTICPHCGLGYRFSRAPQWIPDPSFLWREMSCLKSDDVCDYCPLNDKNIMGPALMIWVGEKFYPRPRDFLLESGVQGVSRRIKTVPKNFEVGKTWVLLAHNKTIDLGEALSPEERFDPGIFSMYRPTSIEVIVDGTESDAEIESYLKRGLTPIMINTTQAETEDELEQTSFLEDLE